MYTIPKTVNQAAKILDQAKPGWAKKIDVSELNMMNPYHCILGQLYGNWDTGGYKLFPNDWGTVMNRTVFAYDKSEWVNEIEKRINMIPMTVSDGAAFLDEHNPGWAKKIDVEKLDMKCQHKCIMGQLYGRYDTGLLKGGWNWDNSKDVWETNAFGRKSDKSSWKQEITKRIGLPIAEGNDLVWAILQMKEGKIVKRKRYSWTMQVNGDKFKVTTGENTTYDTTLQETDKSHLNAKDWVVSTPKVYLKDLKQGQKFDFVGSDGMKNCVKVNNVSYPNVFIDDNNELIFGTFDGYSEVKVHV